MKITDKYIFFYGGVFSQWYRCDITIDGVKYCTAEQFMMAEKARLFDDDYALKQIMKNNNPLYRNLGGEELKISIKINGKR